MNCHAALWRELPGARAQCLLCRHFCRLRAGEWGMCGVRGCAAAHDGHVEMFTLVAQHAVALHVDPIEKKPLYHYLPGSSTLSLGAFGCNFDCAWCQNSEISRPPLLVQHTPETSAASFPVVREQRRALCRKGPLISPDALVQAARDHNCASIAFTYTEPTVFFELMRACAEQAKSAGLGRVMVSNGYQSPACLEALAPLIDAANIDLKSFSDASYRHFCRAGLRGVLDNLARMRRLGWWLEITTLLVPGVNDSPEECSRIARFIHNRLGADTPWHISAFFPCRLMSGTPRTSPGSLEIGRDIGVQTGLRHVYIGNTAGRDQSTHCPACGETVVQRNGFHASALSRDGRCPHCGRTVSGIWPSSAAVRQDGEKQ